MKRILLCTFMLCCCISSLFAQMGTWTDENGVGWEFWTNGNEATITRAYNYGTEVVVPGKVTMEWPDANVGSITQEYTVTGLESEVFWEGRENLTKVILPSTIKTIGNRAFNECSALKSVDLSACTTIGYEAFYCCTALTSVGDLSACTSIGAGAFNHCSALTSVDLSACTKIGDYTFNSCSALTSVGDLSNCSSIGNAAFQNCSALTSVDLSNCESLGNQAFDVCRNLTSIGSLSNCKTMGDYALAVCEKLEEVGDLSNCTSMGIGIFAECFSLKSVDVSHLTSINERMFDGCSALISVGNLTKCTNIDKQAFQDCSALKSIPDLPECETIGDQAFYNCSSLTTVGTLPKCKTIGSQAFACFDYEEWIDGIYHRNENRSSLTSIGDLSACTSIGNDAFAGCDVLKSITLPSAPPTLMNTNSVGTYILIRVPEQDIATYKAANIWSDPIIKNRIISSNGSIDYVVTNTALNTGTPGLAKEIADEDMLKVVTLKVSGTINSYDIIAMNNWMPNLRWLDLTDATIEACDYEYYTGEKTTDNVIGNCMFKDQDEYVSIKLPKNVVNIGNEAFFSCSNLKEVVMHKGVTSIGENTFGGCGNLSEILIPEGCERIGYYAFQQCSKLNSVAFPTSLKSIDNYAFRECI